MTMLQYHATDTSNEDLAILQQKIMALPNSWNAYKDKVIATIQPTVEFSLTDTPTITWQSKVGGLPYLPQDFDYPTTSDGEPLAFLAQINFADMPSLPDFPTQGILQFFIANDDLYGLNFVDMTDQSTFRVVYHADVVQDMEQLQSDLPTLVEPVLSPLPEGADFGMVFHKTVQAITTDSAVFAPKILDTASLYEFKPADGQELGEFFKSYDSIDQKQHRIGGYAFFTQTDPREYNTTFSDYILLFQLDSDHKHDILWGDVGVGGFFIHPNDLKALDFSKVFYNWDCS